MENQMIDRSDYGILRTLLKSINIYYIGYKLFQLTLNQDQSHLTLTLIQELSTVQEEEKETLNILNLTVDLSKF
jgi:hypothetical protein